MAVRRPYAVARRYANHAGGAVLGCNAVVRHKPGQAPAGQVQRFHIGFVQNRYAHSLTRSLTVWAIWCGVNPKARISSSYVPEWIKRGRPSASSVLMVNTRPRSTGLLRC